MDKIWRLLTAMFAIVVACGLFALAYMSSGGRFNDLLSGITFYVCLFCVLFGIAKGLMVIIDYHREHKDEDESEE
ncbi:MAG: hypothetical protein IJ001_08530 [Oscillospiraceae bacterium]|nr:hypothetical protein [Oscillospiraceae bacterium]